MMERFSESSPTIRVGNACVALMLLLLATAGASAEDAAKAPAAKLTLANGEFMSGRLLDSDQPQVLRWQSDAFVSPFDFARSSVSSIHFPSNDERPTPTGNYCFELTGGDVLFGNLAGLSAEAVDLELESFGRVRLTRSGIRRISRWGDGAVLLYTGPNGLADWEVSSPASGWRDELGHLTTERSAAFIHKDFKLPAQAAIEIEMAWKKKPDFTLSLGCDASNLAAGGAQPFQFEVWLNHLVIMRETDFQAGCASVSSVEDGPGRLHVIVYLDQQQQRILIASPTGNKLADLQVTSSKNTTYPGIHLTNNRGDVRLERLRISRWNGDDPRVLQADESRSPPAAGSVSPDLTPFDGAAAAAVSTVLVQRADGSIVFGELASYDSSAKEFVLAGDDGETRIAAAEVDNIVMSAQRTTGQSAVAVLRDGTRLSGEMAGVQAGKLSLAHPGINVPLAIPVTSLKSLLLLDAAASTLAPTGRAGRLELPGSNLTGSLIAGKETPDASCLVWQPHGSATASPLAPGFAGRIVYRVPPSRLRATRPTPQAQRVNRGFLPALFAPFNSNQLLAPVNVSTQRALYLRTGDMVPCEVTAIDEKGVTFKSETTDATFVPHDKIKAVQLGNSIGSIRVDKAKQERLLTLPRMQRDNPPTHLIRSDNGDYLRARIESMDEEFLTVEVRLESRRLKRSRIAEIIWLHDDELGDESAVATSQPLAPAQVQAVRSNGTRLTFRPESCDGRLLSGTSDVLGRCGVDLENIDMLLIGRQVDESAAQLAFGRWRLQHATDPKFVTADGSTARPLGTESEMVGKPAPNFTLKLLDGTPFQLSQHRGKVVILDFWATWCGPCIQAMPEVYRVVSEFKDQDVELIAVNLQEAPDAIRSTLERLKLDPVVALDIDGVVADRYAATAIPQTVIIDRDGNVARLFVGGDYDFADRLRTALQAVVDGDASDVAK